jgi:ribosomal protein S18 acetylase RimI-like enzyme
LPIREARAEDIHPLAAFARLTYARAFGESLAAGDLEHHLAHRLSDAYFAQAFKEDAILLACDPDLIGFAQIGAAEVDGAAPGDAMLRRLFVHPARQSAGVGSLLMRAVLAHPRLEGARCLYLDVWGENHGALRLYERFGFTVVGTVPFVTPSGKVIGEDLLMRRPLP